ncbi:MAG: hypothetical protein HOJ35_01990, partial [Bdellovibrionales bacterium]|nr:hypothetical protein [Bdellovibrionales bacterium]
MKDLNKYLLALLLLLASINIMASNDQSIPEITIQTNLSIFKSQDNQEFLVVSYKNAPHWHTYWKNPGDAGLPIKMFFSINNDDFIPTALEWPTPDRYFEDANLWGYGYEGEYSFFFKLTPTEANKLRSNTLNFKSNWLICKHICIPGQIEMSGIFANNKFNIKTTSNAKVSSLDISSINFQQRLINLPQLTKNREIDFILSKNKTGDGLILLYNLTGINPDKINPNRSLLMPFPTAPFDFRHEELFIDKKGNLFARTPIEWDGEYQEPEIPFPTGGKFTRPYTLKFIYSNPKTGVTEIISKTFSTFSTTAGIQADQLFGMNQMVFKIEHDQPETKSGTKKVAKNNTYSELIRYILFAFLGGIILNFMPCVFPVISIKLFGLIKHKGSKRSKVLKHNLFYTLGIIFTFIIMAIIVIAIKSGGENIGWGFQLQSPTFVGAIVIALWVFTLNLFGLFEFRVPGGKSLGNVQLKDGVYGDFFSGVLATILSTPCSAPLLGTALTFAFTSSSSIIFLIFISIGVGLAFPFILTAIFPQLISFLPSPGQWMENLKKFLGLTLILTMIWLIDIFYSLTNDSTVLLYLNIALAFLFFAFYLQKHITKNRPIIFSSFLIPIVVCFNLFYVHLLSSNIESNTPIGLQWEKWSVQKMQDYKSSKDIVFIDFTAKWCFTCKVNEKLVLETQDFENLVQSTKIKLLLADWTKRDKIIGDWLIKNGMA